MTAPLPPIPARLRAAIEAENQSDVVGNDERDRIRARLAATLALPPIRGGSGNSSPPGTGSASPGGSPGNGGTARSLGAAKGVVTGLAIAGLVAGGILYTRQPDGPAPARADVQPQVESTPPRRRSSPLRSPSQWWSWTRAPSRARPSPHLHTGRSSEPCARIPNRHPRSLRRQPSTN